MKNPILAPYVGLVLRVTLSRCNFFVITQFDADLSSGKWKDLNSSTKQSAHIPDFKQNGLNVSFGFNYSVHKIYDQIIY